MSLSFSLPVPFSMPATRTRCARVLLALIPLGFAAAPASAATIYSFNFFGSAAGHFITDGASADPGYELVTSLTFDYVTTTDLVVHTGPFTAAVGDLEPGAAYNPTTREFINHFVGNTYDDIGLTFLTGPSSFLFVYGHSFSRFGNLDGEFFSADDQSLRSGSLSVGPGVPVDAAAVPEPATLLLLGTGLIGAAAAQRKRMRSPEAR